MFMALLKRISLKGYRSIKETDLLLRPLNVMIGANGAGKSNLISFFKMLNEMMAGRLQQYIATTGRAQSVLHYGPKVTPHLDAELVFEADKELDHAYFMRMIHAANDTLVFTQESLTSFRWEESLSSPDGKGRTGRKISELQLGSGHRETRIGEKANQGEPTAQVFRRLLDQCHVYHFHDTSPTARIRQYGYIGDNRRLLPDAGNLAAMLYAYREKSETAYRRIVSAVKKVLPEFADFDLAPDRTNPREIALNWRKENADYLFGPHQISDGALRAMAIITLFLQPADDLPEVIILDEPELGLHPYALEIVAGLMRAASVKSQVIVATQSPGFLEHFEAGEIIVAESVQGSSHFRRLEPEQLKDWLEDYTLGELWQRNVLGGGPVP
jgi:predicted ATPase